MNNIDNVSNLEKAGAFETYTVFHSDDGKEQGDRYSDKALTIGKGQKDGDFEIYNLNKESFNLNDSSLVSYSNSSIFGK